MAMKKARNAKANALPVERLKLVGVDARAAAQLITDRIFETFDGQEATRIVLRVDGQPDHYGGWGYESFRNCVVRAIEDLGLPLKVTLEPK